MKYLRLGETFHCFLLMVKISLLRMTNKEATEGKTNENAAVCYA